MNKKKISQIDLKIVTFMHNYGRIMLRYSLAIIFIWFGALKPLGISPAAELVESTIYWLPSEIFLPILGWWEVIIGICLIFRPLLRVAIFLLFAQMGGTIMPLFILQDVCYTQFPFGLTLEGQYIIKNLLIISSALVIGGSVRNVENNENIAKV